MTTSSRVVLTDNSAKWFDVDTSIGFAESTTWDGCNHISNATGSQWDHQRLYYTRSGNWILNCWSQWQGSTETYSQIDEQTAIAWLISQESWNDDSLDELPNPVRESIRSGIKSAEL